MYKLLILFLISTAAHADPALEETRYTSKVIRNSDGSIHRRADVVAAFKRIHPCPSTGKTYGACPNWQANHTIPLACGGTDTVSNLMWAHKSIKTGSAATCPYCIDRVELKINAALPPIPDTANCVNEVIK